MSHWNYRICKESFKRDERDTVVCYTIREAYYNDAGDIWAVTEDGVSIYGDSDGFDNETEILDDMKGAFENMGRAFEKPVLDLDTIEYASAPCSDET